MGVLKTMSVSVLVCVALSKTLSAKECVNIKKLDVNWTSYKTLEKIGVSGHFNNVNIKSKQNASNINHLLLNTTVNLNMSHLDADNDMKNSAINKFFVNNLSTKNVSANVVSLYEKSLDVKIMLNGVTKVIPMKYTIDEGKIKAMGVIDALDFGLASALKILNTAVAGHLNKGWYDIPISFDITYNTKCI